MAVVVVSVVGADGGRRVDKADFVAEQSLSETASVTVEGTTAQASAGSQAPSFL